MISYSNPYNADTEAPDDDDALIDDPEQQMQLRFKKYVRRLRRGAWGDHIAIQGISNHFNIAINVMSSEHSQMFRVVPRNGTVEHEVYIGCILQYHFVGLDLITLNVNSHHTTSEPNDVRDPLNDDIIAEGDEHIRQITGGPQTSMMSLENPKSFRETVSIAPAEGLSNITDKDFKAMVCKP